MTERLHFHFSLSCIGKGNGNPHQRSCLENPRDGGAWWAAVYGVAQSWTQLKRLSSSSIIPLNFEVCLHGDGPPWWLSGKKSTCQYRRCREDPLEKLMATHSSILAWEMPWTEEPGGLQSMGLQKSET